MDKKQAFSNQDEIVRVACKEPCPDWMKKAVEPVEGPCTILWLYLARV